MSAMQRNWQNCGVAAAVKVNSEKFPAFTAIIDDDAFRLALDRALNDSNGRDAADAIDVAMR